jgi:hypothetical protein
MQGVGAALAGLIAEQTGPGTAMAVIAAISVTVTLLLAPGLSNAQNIQIGVPWLMFGKDP